MFVESDGLSAEHRLREAAAILAVGVLRLRGRFILSDDSPKLPLTCLDLPAETSLSVRVVNGTDTDERNET
jgi:hypothetical protein